MAYRPQSPDTSRDTERVQFAIFARMTAAEKLERVRALSRTANRLALAGLGLRHPDENEAALRARLVVIRLGPALAARVATAVDG